MVLSLKHIAEYRYFVGICALDWWHSVTELRDGEIPE